MKRFTFIAVALLLTACSVIPVKTLYKLATADFMTVDPRVLRVAAQMPNWVAPRPDGVKLELTMQRAGETPMTERFILEAIPLTLEGKALNAKAKPDYTLYAYRLSPADLARIESIREQIKKEQAKGGPKRHTNLGVGIDACRKTELPAGKILVTTYLKWDRESGYLPLLVDYDLRQTVAGQELATLIPPCSPAPL